MQGKTVNNDLSHSVMLEGCEKKCFACLVHCTCWWWDRGYCGRQARPVLTIQNNQKVFSLLHVVLLHRVLNISYVCTWMMISLTCVGIYNLKFKFLFSINEITFLI